MNEDHERTNQLTLMWSKDISEWDGSSSHCPFIPNIEKEGLPTAKSSVSLLCFYNKNPLSFVDFPDLQVYLIFHISESKHENSQKSLQLKDSYVGSPSWQPKEHSRPTNILPLITKQEVGESLYFEKVCDWLYILKSLVTHWNIVNLTKATHFKKKKTWLSSWQLSISKNSAARNQIRWPPPISMMGLVWLELWVHMCNCSVVYRKKALL